MGHIQAWSSQTHEQPQYENAALLLRSREPVWEILENNIRRWAGKEMG